MLEEPPTDRGLDLSRQLYARSRMIYCTAVALLYSSSSCCRGVTRIICLHDLAHVSWVGSVLSKLQIPHNLSQRQVRN